MKKLWNAFLHWRRRQPSITSKLTLVLLILFPCVMVVTGIYFYGVLSKILTQNITKDLSQLTRETNNQIESQFDMVDNAAIFMISNPEIRQCLKDSRSQDTLYMQTKRKQAVENQMGYSLFYNYAWESNLFESAYIFQSEAIYYYLNRYFKLHIFEDHLDIYRQFVGENMILNLYPPSEKNGVLYLARDIKENSGHSLGTIILGIDEKSLEKSYLDTLGYLNAQVYIYDGNGIVFSSQSNEMLGKTLDPELLALQEIGSIDTVRMNGQTYYAAVYTISRVGLKTLILIPEKEMMSSFHTSMNLYMLVILAGIILSVFLGAALSSRITRPIKNLANNINRFKGGDFSVKMPPYREYELNELSSVFNKMTDEIQDLFAEIYEKQLLIKESEFKLLQSQVNPHFLFNVLDVISWEARIAKNDKVYEMITSLGQLMIANITFSDKEKLTVKQEREYIEFYLFLQKMRFGEKLIISVNMDDESLNGCCIPKFCVYTVVENAIVHGLENRVGEKKLRITATRKEQQLVFEVEDNGVGFDITTVDLESPSKRNLEKKGSHTNIGLYNANKRIQLLYGKKYGITLQSQLDCGTKVTIRLPMDKEDGDV